MPGCSKGARGLSVPWRVSGVFTGTTISPSARPRQCPGRYTIRAGRNLPDKEFRYLRTVIVTAAVYRGFGSELRPCGLTPPLNLPAPGRCQSLYVVLTTLQRPVFLINSRLGPFTATPFDYGREGFRLLGAPLLPKLRGQFAEFLSRASLEHLGLFDPPTCVGLRYGHLGQPATLFLAACLGPLWGRRSFPYCRVSALTGRRICLSPPPTPFNALFRQGASLTLLRHASG
jgi:hypothetical protein